MLVALPAAGKSTLVKTFADDGYTVLSRDIEGGDLSRIDKKLRHMIEVEKIQKIVLDSTYTTVASRSEAIAIAKKNGYKITCLWLQTSLEDAQYNAVTRVIAKHGRLLSTKELIDTKDPNMFPMAALYTARKKFENPSLNEGFTDIQKIPFVRKKNPEYTNKALILDYDQNLRYCPSGDKFPVHTSDVAILPGRKEKIQEYVDKGYILLGVSNQSGVEKGLLTHEMAQACIDKTNELLGFDIDAKFCPHKVPPITCFCRKPGSGYGVEFIEKYKLDASQCIMVGDAGTDKTFAARCGFKFIHTDDFFI